MGEIEQTLFICREANVFKIPPRVGAGGYRSGDWRIADKIFTGRVKVVAKGDNCEVRLEDPNTGNLFATCPVPKGQREIAVEQASDSSRNFVLRLLDPTSGRHAFIGLSFVERGDAFDFNVALSDHEKHTERAAAFVMAAAGDGQAAAAQQETAAEAELLYKKQDLSLKEGQTMKINMKRTNEAGGFLSKLGSSGGSGTGAGLVALAPPPAAARPAGGLAPPPQAFGFAAPAAQPSVAATSAPWGSAAPVQPPPAADGFAELLGGFGGPGQPPAPAPNSQPARDGWATFD